MASAQSLPSHAPASVSGGASAGVAGDSADQSRLTEPPQPSDHPFDRPLATLRWSDPFHWLALGWRDFTRAPLIGLFYGSCFAVMGWALLAVFKFATAYTLALSAGFLLMGPFLCLGLYHASRSIERGERPVLSDTMTAWRHKGSAMATFGFILLIVEMLWGRSAMVVFAVSFDGIPDFAGSPALLLTLEYLPFVLTYLAVGAIFAGLIFGISVISIPMILDQAVDAISAGLTSLRLVLTQPGVMVLWGVLLSVVVILGMLPGFVGLLVAGPVVGHATWHAYRAVTMTGR